MNRPYFIAEISSNHCGSLKIAKKLIKIAKNNGADAVKLQTYDANSMTLNSKHKNFLIKKGMWKGERLWSLYDRAKTPFSWHKELFEYSKKLNIECFSTPFDIKAVNFLEKLKCPFYKISSFEMNDIPLLKRIAETKKSIILSTGTSSLKEIINTVNYLQSQKVKKFSILYCVSNYPAKIEDFNLNNIKILKKKFKCKVGLSDHSIDNTVAIAAASVGAEIFEKHICTKESKNSPDFKFSLIDDKIKEYRKNIDDVYKLFKKNKFHRNRSENLYKKFRRSIYCIKDIDKGEKFTIKNIKLLRPTNGLGPEYFYKIINKRSPSKIKFGAAITQKIFKKINS